MARRIIKRHITPPTTPVLAAALTVDENSLDVVLQMDSVGVLPLASYTLERSLDQSTWTQIASGLQIFGADMIYPDTGLLSSRTYYYRCRAVDTSGRVSSYGYASGYTSPPPNYPPEWATGWTLTIAQGGQQSVAGYATDPNGDSLTFSRNGGNAPAGVTVTAQGLVRVAADVVASSYTVGIDAHDGTYTTTTTVPIAVTAQTSAELYTRFAGLTENMIIGDTPRWRFDGTDSQTGQVFSTTSPQLWGAQDIQPSVQFLGTANGSTRDETQAWYTSRTNPSWEVRHGVASGATGLRITKKNAYTVSNSNVATQAAYHLRPAVRWDSQSMVYMRMVMRFDPTWADQNHYYTIFECKQNTSDATKVELAINVDGGLYYLTLFGWDDRPVWHPWALNGSTPKTNSTPLQTSFWATNTNGQAKYFSRGVATLNDGTRAAQNYGEWFEFEWAYRLQDSLGQTCGGPAYANAGWIWAASGLWSGTPYGGAQRFYVPGQNCGIPHGTGSVSSGSSYIFAFNYYTNYAAENKWIEIRELEVRTTWPDGHSYHPAGAV